MAEPYLTPRELAALLKVSVDTVRRLQLRGTIRVHRVGRWPRYLYSEVRQDTAEVSLVDQRSVDRALYRVALRPIERKTR